MIGIASQKVKNQHFTFGELSTGCGSLEKAYGPARGGLQSEKIQNDNDVRKIMDFNSFSGGMHCIIIKLIMKFLDNHILSVS